MNFLLLSLFTLPAVLAQTQTLTNTTIHPNFNQGKCLDVQADVRANGTPVQIYDCNGTPAQNWTIITGTGSTKVQLAGTNFCLDAGDPPFASGRGMKIWTCFDGLAAQQWSVTAGNNIQLQGQGQCLDLTNGDLTNGNQVQTWACTANNNNQVWSRGTEAPPTPPSTVAQLHPNGNTNKCVDVRAAAFTDGTPVQIYDCNGTPAQNWVLTKGSTKVQLNGTNFCLDAGVPPFANGRGMKIWTCSSGLAAQQWFYTADNRVALENQGMCLDLTNGSLDNGNQLQTWQCTDGNTNQVWTE